MMEDLLTDEETIQIDKLIEEVAAKLPEVIKEKEETLPVTTEPKTDDELINITLQKNDEVENLANKAFELFFQELQRGTDRSSASKEQMLEALKVRVELNKTIVELAKLKKKQENKVGVLINTMSPTQAGIDMRKIQEEFE